MDAQLRSLERAAATGDPVARERLQRERWRADIPTGITVRKLAGPDGVVTRAAEAWMEKGATADQFIRFAAAISAAHGVEFGAYCVNRWQHGNGSVSELMRSALALGRGYEDTVTNPLVVRFLNEVKEALGH